MLMIDRGDARSGVGPKVGHGRVGSDHKERRVGVRGVTKLADGLL